MLHLSRPLLSIYPLQIDLPGPESELFNKLFSSYIPVRTSYRKVRLYVSLSLSRRMLVRVCTCTTYAHARHCFCRDIRGQLQVCSHRCAPASQKGSAFSAPYIKHMIYDSPSFGYEEPIRPAPRPIVRINHHARAPGSPLRPLLPFRLPLVLRLSRSASASGPSGYISGPYGFTSVGSGSISVGSGSISVGSGSVSVHSG